MRGIPLARRFLPALSETDYENAQPRYLLSRGGRICARLKSDRNGIANEFAFGNETGERFPPVIILSVNLNISLNLFGEVKPLSGVSGISIYTWVDTLVDDKNVGMRRYAARSSYVISLDRIVQLRSIE